jgi:murein DD-endopeptidase MepM/ murein hydrolase activator NlpD
MEAFSNFLNGISSTGIHVFDKTIAFSKYVPLDLSIDNELLKAIDVSSTTALGSFVNAHIQNYQGLVAFGGYNETRNIYQRSTHFNKMEADNERNIHLGVDLWAPEGTVVYTPLNGTVHSFKNNTHYGDYGPTIILKHNLQQHTFYTLYGHLSLKSISHLKVGMAFKQGELLGDLGGANINGDYPPHLHFQIIKNIQNYQGDYPGVCSKKDLDFYLNNCPDPNTLLKLRNIIFY